MMRKLLFVLGILGLILSAVPLSAQTINGGIFTGTPLNIVTKVNFALAYQNVPYNGLVSCTGGTPPYTFSISPGSLPTGLTLNTTNGSISGTPTGTGSSSFSEVCTDNNGKPASVATGITVATLVSPFIVITPINQSILTSATLQMKATPTWSSGPVPAGLAAADITTLATWSCTGTGCSSVSSTGLFTATSSAGTPTINASFNGQNAVGVTVTVGTTSPTITNAATLCSGAVLQPYPDNAPANPTSCVPGSGEAFFATGGSPPYTWAVVSGCATGLSFTGNVLGGTPSASGAFASCQIKVTDSLSVSNTSTFANPITAQSSTTVSPSSPTVNVGSTLQMTATANYNDSATVNVTTGNSIANLGSVGCGNASSTSTTSINCPAINLPAGALLIGQVSCSATAGTFTASDGGSNSGTFPNTQIVGPTTGGYFKSNMFYVLSTVANSNAVFTLSNGATSCGFWAGNLAWYQISSPTLDQHPVGETNASSSSLSNQTNAAALTTTAAQEVIVMGAVNGATNRVWTATSPLALRVAQSGGQSALGEAIVSSIQSAQTYAMSFGGAADNHISQILSFSATSTGAAWSITAGNCSVTGNGLLTANGGTSCTVQASFGGLNGTQTITINSPVLQSIAITPPSPNGAVGSTIPLIATGTYIGGSTQNITSTATWSSSNNTSIPVSSSGVVSCTVAGTTTITAAVGSISGTDLVTCSAVSGNALLTGCTVSSVNAVNFGVGGCPTALPAGWTLAAAQGFETGSLPAGQAISQGAIIDCTKGHTGNCSVSNFQNYQGASNQWFGHVTGHQAYLSEWDWGGGGAANEEYMLFHVIKGTVGPTTGQEDVLDFTDKGPGFNVLCPKFAFFLQGFVYKEIDGQSQCYFTNVWNQWEFWWKANTPGSSDGFFRAWLNGVQIFDLESANLNGTFDMTLPSVQGGGYYTKNVWTNNGLAPNAGGTCTSGPGIGSEAGSWIGAFNAGTLNPANCPPAPPAFTRYTDDIILLQQ